MGSNKKFAVSLILGAALSLGGCSSPCERSCDVLIECMPKIMRDLRSLFGGDSQSCAWKDEDAAMNSCVSVCESKHASAGEDSERCASCLEDETADGCGISSISACSTFCNQDEEEEEPSPPLACEDIEDVEAETEPFCTDSCTFSDDGACDDSGPDSSSELCEVGTDCSDCGPREASLRLCTESCAFSDDGTCDDGGPGSTFSMCELGTDCIDCGCRTPADAQHSAEGESEAEAEDDDQNDLFSNDDIECVGG